MLFFSLSIVSLFASLFSVVECHSSSHTSRLDEADCTRDFCQLSLSNELLKRYKITVPDGNIDRECAECKITVQLELEGYSWIGFGVSGNSGGMVGSHVIIGEPDLSEPKSYYLNGKSQSAITRSDIVLEDATIDFIDDKTIMEFTTTFESLGVESPIDTEPAGISLSDTSSFIWSHGKDGQNELGYHGSNKAVYGLNDLSKGSSSEAKLGTMAMSSNVVDSKSKWLAHGILAFISWGVCAPVAIVSAIFRDFNKYASNFWFHIHLGCNSLNYFFTVVVFSLGVSTIKKEGYTHWYHAHNKMGLAILLLATFQVIGGVLRPKTGDIANKSKTRHYWEFAHGVFGLSIFLFGVWQMYAGIILYISRYDASKSKPVLISYIIWMGSWTGLIVGGSIYKLVYRKKSSTVEDAVIENENNIITESENAPENEVGLSEQC